MKNSNFDFNNIHDLHYGSAIDAVENSTVAHNKIYNIESTGININGKNNKILNNEISYCDLAGIIIDNSNFPDENKIISNNIIGENNIENNKRGIWFYNFLSGNADVLNISIIGNIIANNSDFGMSVNALLNESNINIYNNLFKNKINATTHASKFNWTNPNGPTPGISVMGGPYIAGNYWSDLNGTGWSDKQPQNLKGYTIKPYLIERFGFNDTAPLVGLLNNFDVEIDSDPQGATVMVDGQSLNVVTPTKVGLSSGKHLVDLDKENLTYNGDIEVKNSQENQEYKLVLYSKPYVSSNNPVSKNYNSDPYVIPNTYITGHDSDIFIKYPISPETKQTKFKAEIYVQNDNTKIDEYIYPAVYQNSPDFTIPWTPDIGTSGDKTIHGTITGMYPDGTEEKPVDIIPLPIKEYFDIYKFSKWGGYPIDRSSPSAAAKDSWRIPNWYKYWIEHDAVTDLKQFDLDHPWFWKEPYSGAYNTQTKQLKITEWAIFGQDYEKYYFMKTSETGNLVNNANYYSYGSSNPLISVATTVAHELTHQKTYNDYHSAAGADSDYDGIDDTWEGALTDVKPFWSDKKDKDTYGLGGTKTADVRIHNFIHPGYATYGDRELMARLGEGDVNKHPGKHFNSQKDFAYYPPTSKKVSITIPKINSGINSSLSNITNPFTFLPVDNNADGLYDIFNTNFTLNINKTGSYIIQGFINDTAGSLITPAWTGTRVLNPGQYNLSIGFPGENIYSSGQNPSTATLQLLGFDHDSYLIYETPRIPIPSAPPYTQFTGSQLSFPNEYSDQMNATGDLQVGVNVKVNRQGNFTIYGMLWDSNNTRVDGAYNTINLPPGSYTIPLTFSQQILLDHQVNSPLTFQNLTITDDSGVEFAGNAIPYTTKSYTVANTLSHTMRYINGSDSGQDINNNGKYEWLNLSLHCSVTKADNYTLSFQLLNQNGTDIYRYVQTSFQTPGDHDWKVLVPGGILMNGTQNSIYTISSLKICNSTSQIVEYKKSAYSTKPYKKSDFAQVPSGLRKITSMTPSVYTTDPGTVYIIKGSGFTSNTGISLTKNDITVAVATNVSCISPTEIRCNLVLQDVSSGVYNASAISDNAIQTTLLNGFTVPEKNIEIYWINPYQGANSGPITITDLVGKNFMSGAKVKLTREGETDIDATTVKVVSSTKITCVFPITSAKPGVWDVKVINPNGQTGILRYWFLVIPPDPIVYWLYPFFGDNTGSVSTMIFGENFVQKSAAKLTNSSISIPGTVSFISSNQLLCSFSLKGAPLWIYNLTITNPDGTSCLLTDAFIVTNSTPTITAITPNSAYNSTSAQITITGSGFRKGVAVTLVSSPNIISGNVTNQTPNRILCTFPLTNAKSGLYYLYVENIDGSFNYNDEDNTFTIKPAGSNPTITDIYPTAGTNKAPLQVVINGTKFQTGATVTISNGTTTKTFAAASVTPNCTKCSLLLTGLPFGVYNVTVTNKDGSSATLSGAFRISYPTPTISTVTPHTGFSTGPVLVTVTGTNFVAGLNATLSNKSTIIPGIISSFSTASFKGTFNLSNATDGIYNLMVTNPDGSNQNKPNCFTVKKPSNEPLIINISPNIGVNIAPVPVTIIGSNFRTGTTVMISNGSTNKTVTGTVTGNTTIKCILPLTGLPIGFYDLTVKNTDGTISTLPLAFQVTNPQPLLITLTPINAYNTGLVKITISGSKFVNGLQAVLTNSTISIPGVITGFTPTKFIGTFNINKSSALMYNLTVINPGGPNTTKVNCFTVKISGNYPSIKQINPATGSNTAALPVVINGSNFRTGATITITNGSTTKTVPATSVKDSHIKCSLLLTGLPYGLYNLSVQNSDGTAGNMTNAFLVTVPGPTVTGISPVIGYNTMTFPVTITGTKFAFGATIRLDNGSTSIPGTVTSVTTGSISGSFPLTGAQALIYNLTVKNPGNVSATKARAFTVQNPGISPVISLINPASGINDANLPVTITGMNFKKPTVYISQDTTLLVATATAGKISTATTQYVTLPLKGIPSGLYNITILNSDGVNGTAQNVFYVTDQAWINRPQRTAGDNSGILPKVQSGITLSGNTFSRQVVGVR